MGLGRFLFFSIFAISFWLILYAVETPPIIAPILAIFLSAIITIVFTESDEEKAQKIAQQQREKEAQEQQIKQEKLQREAKIRQEAAEKIQTKLRKRIKDFLRENPGEFFDEMELQQQIGISTASEDANFFYAVRSLPYEKGFRYKDKEIGYETSRRYYYYVDPDE